ncbi:MAG: hypothetical protein EOM66_10255 [Clostridia bacterium]|nr:hypothetical protein [Clostridia bacterium]
MGKKGSKKRGRFLFFIRGLALALMLAALFFVLFVAAKFWDLNAWHDFDPHNILDAEQTLVLYDGTGEEITRLHSSEDRVPLSIDDIPLQVRQAFISAEEVTAHSHLKSRKLFRCLPIRTSPRNKA